MEDYSLEPEQLDPEYREVSDKEIEEAMTSGDSFRAFGLMHVNETANEAKERRLWKPREKEFRNCGWYLTLYETQRPEKAVCLWSCWLGDQFYIGHPKDEDKGELTRLVKETLGARGVDVSISDFWPYTHYAYVIEQQSLRELKFGYKYSGSIAAVCRDSEKIGKFQELRDNFIELMANLSLCSGKPNRLTINYDLLHTIPNDLEREEYFGVTWLKGEPGRRIGWGEELVYARKPGEEIMLKSGNSIVPWITVKQSEISNLSKADIIKKIQLELAS